MRGPTPEQLLALYQAESAYNSERLYYADVATAIKVDIPPPVEIVEGVLCECSKLMLAGGSKSFKSWCAMDLAVSVASGSPWWGNPTQQKRVVYANLELKDTTFYRRLRSICGARRITLEPGQLVHVPLRGRMTQTPLLLLQRIQDVVTELEAGVLVLDPLYKLLGTLKENSAEDLTQLLNGIDTFTTHESNPCAVVLCDHFPKGDMSGRDPMDRLAGSGAKARDADHLLVLTRHNEEDCFAVNTIHRELPPIGDFVVRWNHPLMSRAENLDPADLRKPGAARKHSDEKLISCIPPEGVVSYSKWAAAAKVSVSVIKDRGAKLIKSGRVVDRGGVYYAAG